MHSAAGGHSCAYMQSCEGRNRVQEIPAMTGTEDFVYVTEKIPGMFVFIGAGAAGNVPLHSPKMILDEKILPLGAAVYANIAVSWLRNMERGIFCGSAFLCYSQRVI